MYDQPTAPSGAPEQPVRDARFAALTDHYAPADTDLEELWAERWAYLSDDRGEHHLATFATFDGLCEHAGGDVLDSGRLPMAAYDLDTGQVIELHVTTPIVTRSEEQGACEHPDLSEVR